MEDVTSWILVAILMPIISAAVTQIIGIRMLHLAKRSHQHLTESEATHARIENSVLAVLALSSDAARGSSWESDLCGSIASMVLSHTVTLTVDLTRLDLISHVTKMFLGISVYLYINGIIGLQLRDYPHYRERAKSGSFTYVIGIAVGIGRYPDEHFWIWAVTITLMTWVAFAELCLVKMGLALLRGRNVRIWDDEKKSTAEAQP